MYRSCWQYCVGSANVQPEHALESAGHSERCCLCSTGEVPVAVDAKGAQAMLAKEQPETIVLAAQAMQSDPMSSPAPDVVSRVSIKIWQAAFKLIQDCTCIICADRLLAQHLDAVVNV